MDPENNPNRENPQPSPTPFQPFNQTTNDQAPILPTDLPHPEPSISPMTSEESSAPFVPIVIGDPKPSHKKRNIFIAVAAIVAVVVSSASVFGLVYNSPSNAVADSLLKVMTAKSSSTTGTFSALSKDKSETSIGYSFQQSVDNQYAGNLNLDQKVGDKNYKMNASIVGAKNKMTYVKVEKLAEISDALLGDSISSYVDKDAFDKLVATIDNKWISISSKDIEAFAGEGSNKDLECVEQKLIAFRTDAKQQSEVRNVYTAHPFFKADQKGLGFTNGRLASHYVVTIDNVQGREFVGGMKNTSLLKAIDGCVETDLAKGIDEYMKGEQNIPEGKPSETIEYWVDVWNHNPVKLKVNVKQDGDNTTFEANPTLNSNPSVTVPKADKSLTDLQSEIETLMMGMTTPGHGTGLEGDTSSLLAQSRDVNRRTDVTAVATQLEVYYNDTGTYLAAGDINEKTMLAKFTGLDPGALQAPETNTFSFVLAKNAGPQTPSLNKYIYQPLSYDETYCTSSTGCDKWIIWWRDEATGEILQKTSLN